MLRKKEPPILLALAVFFLLISGIRPFDRTTWLLEIAPILFGFPILIALYRRFPLTSLLYRLIFIHALILIVGGHYTYAKVPLGFWMQDLFGFTRNHYDRIGHFAQGFVPAILAREILLRTSPLVPGRWLFFIVASLCLAFSAFYELFEWWTAVILGQTSDAFLGTQGDVWDTQWDMFFAMVGALTSQISLAKLHDRALKGLNNASNNN